MISRRQLIGNGVAASALGFDIRAAIAGATPPRSATRVTFLLVDERFEAAGTLAQKIAAPGARYLALPRDVLDLWYRQLAPACRTGAHTIAGVTTERGFFLLRTLAADHGSANRGLRVISRTVHGALVSWVIGPK